MIVNKCKICRHLGLKLFLKGERCVSPKCAMIKKPYPPGQKRKRRSDNLSEYNKELREKQKLRNWYGLSEVQLQKYVKNILKKKHGKRDAAFLLVQKLEKRLDNVIFRMGIACSRVQARQFVSHKHFLVNNKKVNIPSYQVKKDDIICLNASSAKKNIFKEILQYENKYQPPLWIKLSPKKTEAVIIGEPSVEESCLPVELLAIFEYYLK